MTTTARLQLPASLTTGNVINGVLFNSSWLAIVYTHTALWALLLTATHLALHFRLMGRGWPEARLVLVIALTGVILDHVLFALGVFTVAGTLSSAPVWISCLWPVLATTLMHAFKGLQSHALLAATLGALGGALSYTAGTGMTDVQFASAVRGPLIMAALWAVLFPAFLRLAAIMDTADGGRHAQS